MLQPTWLTTLAAPPAALPGTASEPHRGALPFAREPDAVAAPWYARAPVPSGWPPLDGTGSVFSFIGAIVAQLAGLLGSLLGELGKERGPQQRALDLNLSSTGDPHLAATGTTLGGSLDRHWDSMLSHDDLLHSSDVPGGYRISTAVTSSSRNGVTANASATVHAFFDRDTITLNAGGSSRVIDDGIPLVLTAGQAYTLSGGETVSAHADGSLVVDAADGRGGTLTTTLSAWTGGVDVSTRARNIGVGGDLAFGPPDLNPA